MMIFSRVFNKKFSEEERLLVEKIYQKYFSNLIDVDVKVGYTGTRVLGKAYYELNTILLREISPHTIAHELMHIAQHNQRNGIPTGEKSCDVFTCALGEDVCDGVTYLSTHNLRAEAVNQVCREAVEKRKQGFRNYISWAEKQFAERAKTNWQSRWFPGMENNTS
jgi:hypothetical protein